MARPGGGDAEPGFDIRTNLRQVMTDLKEFDPKLATEVRKRMRASGDAAIAAMASILDEESGGVVTGKTRKKGTDSRGRARSVIDEVHTRDANRARSRGSRQEIKRGLKLRVNTGKSRTTVRLATSGGALRKPLNRRTWRHPVFDGGEWVEQPGNQYFSRGAWSEAKALRNAMEDAIQIALDALETRSPTID